MKGTFEHSLGAVAKVLNIIGGAALTFMMFLTVADVLMRAGGHPIIGTYEIVALSLALVIGFGIPKVSLDRGHVYMEFLWRSCPREQGHPEHLYADPVHHSVCFIGI